MKNFIEENPALVFVMFLVGGIFSFMGAGVVLSTMMDMAEVGSPAIFKLIGMIIFGSLFTILPLSYLYDIISNKRSEITRLEHRLRVHTPTRTRARRGEAEHWQADEGQVDDVDGDGEGDDSLRRLGVIR